MFWRWNYRTCETCEAIDDYFDKLIEYADKEIKIGDLVLYTEGCHFTRREGNKVFGIYSDDESQFRSAYRYSFSLKIDTNDDKTVIKCSARPGWFGMIASAVLPLGVLASVTLFSEALILILIIGLCVIALNTISVVDLKKELDKAISPLQKENGS